MFNILCNHNIWAKFLVQTLVWTAAAFLCLASSEFVWQIRLNY